ncbi:hypothetical protein GFS24_28865 [Chitinophaga sp. SYP-B3965]|uniref:hypothetical protein n=1 Tax=Chitinophaga sp. SYP-B3965 TaxID=2663120 RepID=UPI001299C8E1|nr:hypothetical protein [Chitinophaga sp. SYP-B3965]MRG49157.1 hypothetical protein [Chitinophaga sp. SYP-B3965]
MSLEQLQLDPYLLAQMYDQPIIPEMRSAQPAVEKALPKVKYLGENQKNVLLLIQNESEAYLNDELFNLLTNILSACKLGMQEVALINVAQYPGLTLADYKNILPVQQCIIFAIPLEILGLPPMQAYQLETHLQIPVLYSDHLQLIATDKTSKGKLWMALKQLFGI